MQKNLSDFQNQQGYIPYILAVAVSFLMQTQLSMKPAGLVAPPAQKCLNSNQPTDAKSLLYPKLADHAF